ncbi:hypothetical protein HU200_016866 [Digitaria exilis]|uniref:Protein kinase domain-containing protein n=1 Tax=Digitaria exilis TaxID=1010633 RepID=A0A835F7Z5_9POAL|nr:hypothetical protein HU200_016866 [Digitaria exilis]
MIVVKKLSETHIDDDQFQKEVTFLFRLKHTNIVKLVGYCSESQWEGAESDGKYVMAEVRNRLLCYEYKNYRSLDKHISRATAGLGWHRRYEIIIGICRALHYLHMECQIAHMDLKTQNILLDENLQPKIAYFGMFHLFDWPLSKHIKENGEATVGYMAPEYFANELVSTTADIFSLGVIIIELMTGHRDYPSTEESHEQFVEKFLFIISLHTHEKKRYSDANTTKQ